MAKARPKTYIMYRIATFDGRAQCYIHCYPQQKWHYSFNGNKAELTYKNIDLCIPKEDFEKHWKVVEE